MKKYVGIIASKPSNYFGHVYMKTRVAHPALVNVAKEVFDKHMPTPNQIDLSPGLAGRNIGEADLLKLPSVPYGEAITSAGLVKGVSIVLAYTEAWLRGVGCIPLSNVSFKTKSKRSKNLLESNILTSSNVHLIQI